MAASALVMLKIEPVVVVHVATRLEYCQTATPNIRVINPLKKC